MIKGVGAPSANFLWATWERLRSE